MTDWKQKAEAFAVKRRELRREGKLSAQADIVAGFLGSILYRLEENPELRDELRGLIDAFQDALGK